jgi:hypothetical protein
MNGVKWRQEKHTDIFGHQFSIFPQIFQACSDIFVTYDEIFQALAVKGGVLFPLPFLDLGFDGVVRWKSPASEMFSQFAK